MPKLSQFRYGVCYYPEAWDEKRHAADIGRIADAGFDFVRLGEGAWSVWEPVEGQFRFELFDRVIEHCQRRGLKVLLGTPTYAGPAWLAHDYPEVLRWDFQRRPLAHGGRRFYNYTSPKYLQLCDRLVSALGEHYKKTDAVFGWQLDNEFNCHMDVSYAPSDTLAFRAWLIQKYRTVEALNQAWGTRFWSQTYSRWEQVDLPHPTVAYLNPTQLLDESRFVSDTVVAFAARQAAILREQNPSWLITHNALFSNVDGPKLVQALDFFSHDQYPLFAAEGDWPSYAAPLCQARSLSFPYGVLEQQSGPGGQMQYLQRTPRPGELRLWAWQSIVHGAKLLSYFRFRTCPYGQEQHWHGLLDPDDRDSRRLAEAKHVGEEARRLPEEFFDAPLLKCVALLRDYDNETNARRINTYDESGAGELERWYAELTRRHVPVDMVWPDCEWSDYRLLIAPHLKIVSASLARQLEQFVRAGGTLLLGAQAGTKDENLHLVEDVRPGRLRQLAGVEVEEWSTLPAHATRSVHLAGGTLLELSTFIERLRPLSAQALGTWRTDDPLLSESPAVTRNALGKGAVIYVGGYCQAPAIASLFELLELSSALAAPPEVEVVVRTLRGSRVVALLNHSPSRQIVSELGDGIELLSGRTLGGEPLVLEPYDVALVSQASLGR